MSLYGAVYLTGFILAVLFLYINTKNIEKALYLALTASVGAILGGRLFYVLFYEPYYYLKNPFEILELYKGGMAYHGGLIGLISALFLFKKDQQDFFKTTDILVYIALIIIPLGRIVNFINGELWGTVSTLPFAVIFEGADAYPRHPVQIYEALLEGPILYLFIKLSLKFISKKVYPVFGTISALYLIGYGLLRALGEIFRESDVFLGRFFNILSMGQILCIITAILGLLLLKNRLKQALIHK